MIVIFVVLDVLIILMTDVGPSIVKIKILLLVGWVDFKCMIKHIDLKALLK